MSGNAYPPIPGGPEPDLSFARRNQKIHSELLHWPEGALEACWRLEDRHPGWHVGWLNENTIVGFERPAGFRATLTGSHSAQLDAPDVVELEELMAAVPEHDYGELSCAWCWAQTDERLRRAGFRV